MDFLSRPRPLDVRHAFAAALEEALEEDWAVAPLGRLSGAPSNGAVQRFQSAVASWSGLSAATGYVAAPSLAAAYRASRGVLDAEAAARRAADRPSPREAAAALGHSLKQGLTVRELRHIRRQFALANHPDRLPTELRVEASEAMALANSQIDLALKGVQAGQKNKIT